MLPQAKAQASSPNTIICQCLGSAAAETLCRADRRTTKARHGDRKRCKGGGFATLCITLASFFGDVLFCSSGGRAFPPGKGKMNNNADDFVCCNL
jgi:hypothetical protein